MSIAKHRARMVINWRRLTAVLSVSFLLAGGLVLGSQPSSSQASSHGAGVALTIPSSGGAVLWFGNHNTAPGGATVYCFEFNIYPTAGFAQVDDGYYGAGFVARSAATNDATIHTKALTTNEMIQLNYIVSKYGMTSNDQQAAAVAYAVWSISTNSTVWSYQLSRPWFVTGTSAFSAAANTYLAEAATYAAAASGSGTGSATLTFELDAANNYEGTLTIATLSPSPASGTITLTNGYFVSTGTSSITSSAFTQGQALEVIGLPPTDDGAPYKIHADATFQGGYAANVRTYTTATNRQHLIGPGQFTTMTAQADDPFDRSVGFQPIVTSTVAQKYLKSGDALTDTLVFSIQPDINGLVNEWATKLSGDYVNVVAVGTVYGPFAAPQIQSSSIPAGAIAAGTATVTTSNADGPTVTYSATADNAATGPGYYVWVWEIRFDDQSALTQSFLPAPDPTAGFDGYHFADEFGIAAETAIVVPDVSTVASSTGLAGYPITDTATVSGVVFEGAQIGFEAFLQVDASATCTPTTLAFTSALQPVAAEGDYISEEFTPLLGGTYFWVETLYDEDGLIAHRGVCGMPLETSVITQFTMSTVATQTVAVGGSANDTATITGVLPVDAELTFSAYWSETSTPVCDVNNLAFSTSSAPIAISAGFLDDVEFTGADFSTTNVGEGYLFWVESLMDTSGNVLATGACGADGETTAITELAYTGAGDIEFTVAIGGLMMLFGLVIGAFRLATRHERVGF